MAKRRVPPLRTDTEAAEFWDKHSLTDFIDDTEPANDVAFAARPLKQVCLRLSERQIEQVKQIAATKGIGYQTMLRMWIAERTRLEAASQ
ncbi:BrnA antitoxin family protein [bacterium]|nr:BrnA antitoxin family protein [bacterium]